VLWIRTFPGVAGVRWLPGVGRHEVVNSWGLRPEGVLPKPNGTPSKAEVKHRVSVPWINTPLGLESCSRTPQARGVTQSLAGDYCIAYPSILV
jgi:hypothetical protein